MKRFIKRRWPVLVILVVLAGVGAYFYCGLHMPARAQASAGKVVYRCPMHPNYTSDRPGDCPICGMKLVKVEPEQKAAAPAAPASAGGGVAGMTAAGPKVAGQGAVYLTPEKQQLIGVRSEPVARTPLVKSIRTVGQVTADESRISRVHTKIGGWVDKLYVNFTGAQVRRGQPLLSIYSPELVATQEEYLLALRARTRLRQSSFREVADGGDSLLAATRRRLQLWDVPDSEIRRIEQTGHPLKNITLYAPTSGYVMDKPVLEGMKVDASTDLMVVADLSSVWVQAEFYESDAANVSVGDDAKLTVNSYPEMSWAGSVDYIFPSVDPQTRTLRARLIFANPGMLLKPGMYGNVMMEKRLGDQITVPEEAVLDSGTRQIVFVDRGNGHYEPREVKVGERANGRREILSGVAPGEMVVTNGNFMIDSESRLKSGLQAMGSMPAMEAKPAKAGTTKPAATPKKGMEGMPGM
jgi:Cu(I)/Ag(I) efflux system membrane fusion protein